MRGWPARWWRSAGSALRAAPGFGAAHSDGRTMAAAAAAALGSSAEPAEPLSPLGRCAAVLASAEAAAPGDEPAARRQASHLRDHPLLALALGGLDESHDVIVAALSRPLARVPSPGIDGVGRRADGEEQRDNLLLPRHRRQHQGRAPVAVDQAQARAALQQPSRRHNVAEKGGEQRVFVEPGEHSVEIFADHQGILRFGILTFEFEAGRDYYILVDEGEGDKRYSAVLVPEGSGVMNVYDETQF